MSSRALRRLLGSSDIPSPSNDSDQSESEEDFKILPKKQKKPVNAFELLNTEELEGTTELFSANSSPEDKDVANNSNITMAHGKKKKKKKMRHVRVKADNTGVADEIEQTLREVNFLCQGSGGQIPAVENSSPSLNTRGLLNVEHKNLNPDNELRRIFGSRVMQSSQENNRRQRNRNRQRLNWLAQPKHSWPPYSKTGLSMTHNESHQNGESEQHFNFEHSLQYQKFQFQFLDAVESLNPQNIAIVAQANPYHIDTIIQLSEVFRMSEDMQIATEFIEKALYSFEMSFHPMFSLTKGTCRLDFRRPENRSFYLALFKHLSYVGQKGCYRTALEYCKLLLNLDPDGDPLCVLLMIDFYALRSEQYDFLIRLYQEWHSHRNLEQLPNFAFSMPLALFLDSLKNEDQSEKADSMLQSALSHFPSFLLPLLDKCGVVADDVTSHKYFTSCQLSLPESLQQLIGLYLGRCHYCWKQPEVIAWLERNVRDLLRKIDHDPKEAEELSKKYLSYYKGTPRNVLRHILLSEIKEATAALPPDLANTPILSYDPLPPTDNITSYTRPPRPRRVEQETSTISLFLRSLMPNFNIDELAEEQGAVGGGNNLRQGVGVLMDAMRNLLQNIHPANPPDDDNNEEHQPDEWN